MTTQVEEVRAEIRRMLEYCRVEIHGNDIVIIPLPEYHDTVDVQLGRIVWPQEMSHDHAAKAEGE